MDARTLTQTVVTALVELEKLEFADLLQVRVWVDQRLRVLAQNQPLEQCIEERQGTSAKPLDGDADHG